MTTRFDLRASLVVAAMLAVPMAQAASLTPDDYKTGKTRIDLDYKADKAACAALADNAKDICAAQANGKRNVARAELEYAHSAKPADRTKILVVKAESNYAVARERCDDSAGNVKEVCVKEASAVEVKALADAKMGKEIGEARMDAAETKREADYKVAVEKCDALAGDAKAACLAGAKASFGKT